jgi:hypothetical protein
MAIAPERTKAKAGAMPTAWPCPPLIEPAPPGVDRRAVAERLNRDCLCFSLDRGAFGAALAQEIGDPRLVRELIDARPHLAADAAAFLARDDFAAMVGVVDAIETATRLAAYRDAVLGHAPRIAGLDFGPLGVFTSYDFHVAPDGPRLIEVNSNAGGAFLAAQIARAVIACCPEAEVLRAPAGAEDFDSAVEAMFEAERRRQGRPRRPARVAIVDDAPSSQYLYPEFLLARRFFERRGVEAFVVDAADLAFDGAALYAEGRPLDLVYNRLVDFALEEERHQALRAAYEAAAVVVTPNPRAHAIYADKRNLAILSDASRMRALGLDPAHLEALRAVPTTQVVDATNADALWAERRNWFFKPAARHGAKGVYRGDKLTRRVFEDIRRGGYVAQAVAAPGARTVSLEGGREARKLDLRLYAYERTILIGAARLFQGQTTNFRTPGGGFAPVFLV